MGDLLVVRGQTFLRVTSVLGIFDQQTFILGYLETTHSAYQFSAAKWMTGMRCILPTHDPKHTSCNVMIIDFNASSPYWNHKKFEFFYIYIWKKQQLEFLPKASQRLFFKKKKNPHLLPENIGPKITLIIQNRWKIKKPQNIKDDSNIFHVFACLSNLLLLL